MATGGTDHVEELNENIETLDLNNPPDNNPSKQNENIETLDLNNPPDYNPSKQNERKNQGKAGRQGKENRGQRKQEPSGYLQNQLTGSKMLKKNELHIKNLEPGVDNTELHNIFKQYGILTEVRVVRNAQDKSKGFALISYKTAAEAEQALTQMNYHKIGEKYISISYVEHDATRPSDPNKQYKKDTIMVRNIPDTWDEEELKNKFMDFGNIIECTICRDGDGNSKRMGFVHYFSYKAAEKAILEMHGRVFQGKPIFLCLSELQPGRKFPKAKPSNPPVAKDKLFIANLPNDVQKEELRSLFSRYGTIRDLKLVPGKHAAIGFIQFVLPKDAQRAVAMDGHMLKAKKIKVTLANIKPGHRSDDPGEIPKKLNLLDYDVDYD
uniref:Polyadenylate-binding protein 8 n=2 Tax=Cacopsylla melanoneura TaxID=428564 RepID=A0A8D9EL36_9HEMI